MPISVQCGCGKGLRVKDEFAGRKVRCPACKGVVAVPVPEPEEEEAPMLLVEEMPEPEPPPRRKKRDERIQREAPRRASRQEEPEREEEPDEEEDERPRRRRKRPRREERESHGSGVNVAAIVSGALMMLGAIVWLVVGLALGWLFYYPPILFIIGLVTLIKGLLGRTD